MRRALTAAAILMLLAALSVDRLGRDAPAITATTPSAGLDASGELQPLLPIDLVANAYQTPPVTADNSGSGTYRCTLVRRVGFEVQLVFFPGTLGLASGVDFSSAFFTGVDGWFGDVSVTGSAARSFVSGAVVSRTIHRCPVRATVIGTVTGDLSNGATYEFTVSAR